MYVLRKGSTPKRRKKFEEDVQARQEQLYKAGGKVKGAEKSIF